MGALDRCAVSERSRHSSAGGGILRCFPQTTPTLVAAAPSGTNTPASASRYIGIEGKASLALPRADYQTRPLDDRTELILRIDKVTPVASNEYRYDFFYMGLEPGAYDLADFLIRPDGTRPRGTRKFRPG
ncbi:MAG: hypothetical protein IPK15_26940 [Verrucomicrobia bacterium]|nr:hypothetical protein [Verrucomicrobiota bacterium]